MTRKLIAVLLVLGLAGCQREASNQPESTTDVTPAATPADTTAATTPPAASPPAEPPAAATPAPAQGASDSTMASQYGTTPAPAATMGDDVVDPMAPAPAPPTAAGGTTLGGTQTDATLDSDLRRCDTMTGTERTTCRSEAQTRYDQRNLEAGGSVEP